MGKPQTFNKILVTNRGEIALRVIRAFRELDIKSVAVYSEADENSLHLEPADEQSCIGPAISTKSYPDMDSIWSAAKSSGAENYHIAKMNLEDQFIEYTAPPGRKNLFQWEEKQK